MWNYCILCCNCVCVCWTIALCLFFRVCECVVYWSVLVWHWLLCWSDTLLGSDHICIRRQSSLRAATESKDIYMHNIHSRGAQTYCSKVRVRGLEQLLSDTEFLFNSRHIFHISSLQQDIRRYNKTTRKLEKIVEYGWVCWKQLDFRFSNVSL